MTAEATSWARNEVGPNPKENILTSLQSDSEFEGVEWAFNPALASHFGGDWEREIQCVRRAFEALLHIF